MRLVRQDSAASCAPAQTPGDRAYAGACSGSLLEGRNVSNGVAFRNDPICLVPRCLAQTGPILMQFPFSQWLSARGGGDYPFSRNSVPTFSTHTSPAALNRSVPAFSTHGTQAPQLPGCRAPNGTSHSESTYSEQEALEIPLDGSVPEPTLLSAFDMRERDRKVQEAARRKAELDADLRRRDAEGPVLGVVCCELPECTRGLSSSDANQCGTNSDAPIWPSGYPSDQFVGPRVTGTTVDNAPFMSQSTLETYVPREPSQGWKPRLT